MPELIIIVILSVLLCIVSFAYFRNRIRVFIRRRRAVDFYNAIQNDTLIHVHTDIQGNKWYTWQDVRQLPPERAIMAEMALHQLDMAITRDSLMKYLNRMVNNCNQGLITKVAYDIETLLDRLSWVAEEKTLEELALVYLVIEGENYRAPSQKDTQRKKKVFVEDEESKGFFLRLAWKNTSLYSSISDTDILRYLAQKKMENQNKKRFTTSK